MFDSHTSKPPVLKTVVTHQEKANKKPEDPFDFGLFAGALPQAKQAQNTNKAGFDDLF